MWNLEDLNASIALDLTVAQAHSLLLTENSVVLVRGSLAGGKLIVQVHVPSLRSSAGPILRMHMRTVCVFARNITHFCLEY